MLKDNRNGKLDGKCDEGIFFKNSYKCLNSDTNKVVESENLKIDEYTEIHEDEQKKEPENYKTFMYYYQGISTNVDNTMNQAPNQ